MEATPYLRNCREQKIEIKPATGIHSHKTKCWEYRLRQLF